MTQTTAPEPPRDPAAEPPADTTQTTTSSPAQGEPSPPTRRRPSRRRSRRLARRFSFRSRRRRPWREHLLSENVRLFTSLMASSITGTAAVAVFPQLDTTLGHQENLVWSWIILTVLVIAAYSMLFTGLTLLALRHQPRQRLLAVARLPRARRQVRFYRYFGARSSAFGEVLQVMLIAILAIAMLLMRPSSVPLELLLMLTIGSISTAWLSSVVTFALEYAAADAHGDGFDLNGTPPDERGLPEYLYAAVLVQTSSGPTDLVPRTRPARGLVRSQALLAYVMNTIIVAMGVSVVLTVFT